MDEIIKEMKEKNFGSSFDEFLREEGIYKKVKAASMKRALAWRAKRKDTKKRRSGPGSQSRAALI